MTDAPAVDVVIPVHNEQLDLATQRPAALRPPEAALPVHVPDHDRGQRQRPTRRSAIAEPARAPSIPEVRAVRLEQKGRGRALREVVVGQRRRRRRLHGRRPLDRPRRRCCRCVAPLLSGHSDVAIGTRLAPGLPRSSADRSASSSRAATTCCCATRSALRLQRRAVRLQGDPRATSPRALLPAGGGRGAGSSTPSCSCSPSATACASTRCPSTGSTTRARPWTSSTPRARTSRASGAWRGGSAPGPSPWPRCATARRPSRPAGRPTACSGSLRDSSSSAWPARWPTRACTGRCEPGCPPSGPTGWPC